MPRIMGVDIPKEKRIEIALTYLYGIGRALSNVVLKEAGVNPDKRAKDLSEEEVSHITNILQKGNLRIEGDLRRDISQNIKRLMDIGSWRGMRHKKVFPFEASAHALTRAPEKEKRGAMSRYSRRLSR